MGTVIHVNFKKALNLDEALEVLGQNLYNLATNVWGLEELERTAKQAYSLAFDVNVALAYEAILKSRTQDNDNGTPCKVISLFQHQKKMAA